MSIENPACKCTTCKCNKIEESIEIDSSILKLLSLMDSPKMSYNLTESDNEIYVNSVDVIKDACGTGRISILDREILMNVCESDNVIHANFDIEVNGKQFTNVPFIIKITENVNYINLNNTLLE